MSCFMHILLILDLRNVSGRLQEKKLAIPAKHETSLFLWMFQPFCHVMSFKALLETVLFTQKSSIELSGVGLSKL